MNRLVFAALALASLSLATPASATGEGGAPPAGASVKPQVDVTAGAGGTVSAVIAPAVVAVAAAPVASPAPSTVVPIPSIGTSAQKVEVTPANPFWPWLIATVIMTIFAAVTLLGFLRTLRHSHTWSLGDALSEEAGNQPILPVGVKPIMVASASRTIALFGLFVIMAGVIGIAYFMVWALFHGQTLDGLEKIMPFFYGSAAIFAPYAINQMKEAFSSFGNGAQVSQPAPTQSPAATQVVVNAGGTPALPAPSPVKVQPVPIAIADGAKT